MALKLDFTFKGNVYTDAYLRIRHVKTDKPRPIPELDDLDEEELQQLALEYESTMLCPINCKDGYVDFDVYVYASKADSDANDSNYLVQLEPHKIPYDWQSVPHEVAYEYLKTLPQFEGAVDV